MEVSQAVATLAALAQDSRLTVFRLLMQAGPDGMAAGKISEATGIPPPSLSFHLKELTHARMVRSRQDGRYVIYTADTAALKEVIEFLIDDCCQGSLR